jgi:hypothetical protein
MKLCKDLIEPLAGSGAGDFELGESPSFEHSDRFTSSLAFIAHGIEGVGAVVGWNLHSIFLCFFLYKKIINCCQIQTRMEEKIKFELKNTR